MPSSGMPVFDYHVAISYAREHSEYVDAVAQELRRRGVRVFYDAFEEIYLWGKDLTVQLEEIYRKRSLYCLMFISSYYRESEFSNMECRSALDRALKDPEYILPARFDDTEIQGLSPSKGYVSLKNKSPQQCADFVLRKLRAHPGFVSPPQEEPPSPGPQERFSYLRSNTNLPPHVSVIGREKEVEGIERLLLSPEIRMVALHGMAGIGKTQLALAVGSRLKERFLHGVWLVSLDRVKEPKLVSAAIAEALGIREAVESRIEESLKQYLEGKQILLLLDGFEFLDDSGDAASASDYLPGLLSRDSRIRVLLTSRRPLRAQEAISNFPVPPLDLPRWKDQPRVDQVRKSGAMELFIRSARKVRPDLEPSHEDVAIIAEVCDLLGGVPLAIELAAAAVGRFPLTDLRTRLSEALTGGDRSGASLRNRTVLSMIEWSYQLLKPAEQRLFRRLAVFSGGFTPEAAERVCNNSGSGGINIRQCLNSLAGDNLLQRHNGEAGDSRFDMPEVIRNYALDQQKKRERTAVQHRHAEYYTGLAEQASENIASRDRDGWLKILDTEYANLGAALVWCLGTKADLKRRVKGDPELGLRLAGALFWFWNQRAYFTEGRTWLRLAFRRAEAFALPETLARAHYCEGGLAFLQGEFEDARRSLDTSVALWGVLERPRDLGFALVVLGRVALSIGEHDLALACETESVQIFRREEDEWGLALACNDLGDVYRQVGKYEAALREYSQSLKLWEEMGDPWGRPLTLSNLGFLEMTRGNLQQARAFLKRAAEIQKHENDRWGLAENRKYLADLTLRDSEVEEAEGLYCESLSRNWEIGRKQFMVGCIAGLATAAWRKGLLEHAARLSGAARALRERYGVSERIMDAESFAPMMADLESRMQKESWLRAVQAEGQVMTLAEAVAYALNGCPTKPRDPSSSLIEILAPGNRRTQ